VKRRDFIIVLGIAALPRAVGAQQSNAPVIGLLGSASRERYANLVAAFRRGLAETGYGGAEVTIEERWAEDRYERLPALATELVQRRVAVIAAVGGNAPALAAKTATADIPIVFVSGGEPVKAGLVRSLARPGGNVTGVNWIATALTAKRLEPLHKLVPKIDLVGVLVNPDYPDSDLQLDEVKDAAQAIAQRIEITRARRVDEIERAFATLVRDRADALLVANDPFFQGHLDIIVALAARHALPACYFERAFAAGGGLMSYGASLTDSYRQAGIYAGRVLKGEKPADLPVLQPTTFELVINLKTAAALGLSIPPALFAQANEVIE
jgi:putative tryptophan/tyrosine transport system substrate-binding protein